MNFDCVFRSAAPTDYDQLRRFLEAEWIELHSSHVSRRSVQRFSQEDGAGRHLDFFMANFEVAVVDGAIVACINLAGEFISALFVDKRYRRNGIGSCLLHNAEISGGRYLVVAAFNRRAISFYEKRGWTTTCKFDEDEFGTRVPSLAMIKGKTRHEF
ncbi:N-acetyltransferase [Sinorhizobium meliloti]|uniref:GNAT family N-acetyltransferase n=1 Tax=Rhizobium meliloti TaxID=382 RepID=UPI0005B25362|nr:GNAT family N-acetyltransferase [Sinorhizobium meliloti]MDE4555501.1 GNAT family N-acetyltransferase [Sinorhizobium meliloti]RVK67254.1 N-acetyltransferase [Sinorhizobium meliloti]